MDEESARQLRQRVRTVVARLLERGRAPSPSAVVAELAPRGADVAEVEAALRQLRETGALYETPRGWRLRAPAGEGEPRLARLVRPPQ